MTEGGPLVRPNRVRIAGLDFAIATESSEDFTDEQDGQINHLTRLIRISNLIDDHKAREILLHEMLHGVDRAFGADLTEHQVTVLSRGIPRHGPRS